VVAIASQNIFVEGLYTIDQAARLARLTPQTLRRWFDGSDERKPAAIRSFPKNDAGVVGFVDLIQALAIRAIRKERKLSLQKIRETIIMAREHGIDYPFARSHQTFLFADDVVIMLPDERLIQVTGKYKRQHLIKPVVELYLDDLCFNAETGLASEYTPLKDGDMFISIKPTVKYGSPVVMPIGLTAGSLINAVDSEGSIKDAASAYGIDISYVKLALRYDDMLAGTAA
jgi:uncharacterized protein (DUF433 family)